MFRFNVMVQVANLKLNWFRFNGVMVILEGSSLEITKNNDAVTQCYAIKQCYAAMPCYAVIQYYVVTQYYAVTQCYAVMQC